MSEPGRRTLVTSVVWLALLTSMVLAMAMVVGGDVAGAGPVRQQRLDVADGSSILASQATLASPTAVAETAAAEAAGPANTAPTAAAEAAAPATTAPIGVDDAAAPATTAPISADDAAAPAITAPTTAAEAGPLATAGASVALEPATVSQTAVRRVPAVLGPIASPDVGAHCAPGLSAGELTEFFGQPIGDFEGADYQRATRLPDDRVLWTFQDAFVDGRLVHNVGMVQSGRCFTPLGAPGRSWLLSDRTDHMRRWHWIMGVAVDATGGRAHVFVVEMRETGPAYLSRTRPVAVRRVVLDLASLGVVEVVDEPTTGLDLYGWSVTSDDEFTYLYSHCYRQFGFDTPLGSDPCSVDVKLARVPLGRPDGPREYWTGAGWTANADAATPVVDGSFALSGNNPAQIHFDGEHHLLVEKRDDWWGSTVEFGVAERPEGPFRHVGSVPEPLKCDRALCNTYFASWVPWSDGGRPIWSIGHNRWNGAETASHLATYRPTFHTDRP